MQHIRDAAVTSGVLVLITLIPLASSNAAGFTLDPTVQYGPIIDRGPNSFGFGENWSIEIELTWSTVPGASGYQLKDDRYPSPIGLFASPPAGRNSVVGPDHHGQHPNVFDAARDTLLMTLGDVQAHLSIEVLFPSGASSGSIPLSDAIVAGPAHAELLTGLQTMFGHAGTSIELEFTPLNGQSLDAFAHLMGVDHFNWINRITHVPDDWTITIDGVLQPRPSPATPLVDPAAGFLVLHDASSGRNEGVRVDENLLDDAPFYYKEPGPSRNFRDRPRVHPDMYGPGEYIGFETAFVGVTANGEERPTGVAFKWKNNAVYDPNDPDVIIDGGVFLSTIDLDAPPTILAGGIFDHSVVLDSRIAPQLNITRTASSSIALSWPTNAPGFILEFANALSVTNWSNVTNEPAIVGHTFSLTVDAFASLRIFRLKKR